MSLLGLTVKGQALLPTPQQVEKQRGTFTPNPHRVVGMYADNDSVIAAARHLLFRGYRFAKVLDRKKAVIVFKTNRAVAPEGYRLSVTTRKVTVEASSYPGFVYALQTLRQLTGRARNGAVGVPCVNIHDQPLMAWRGFMLDSGRQYQTVDEIKHCLDLMSMLKMNRFHWHLTEGLGWRLYSERYPRLTSVGAYVGQHPGQQGFYTHDDVREIVGYARRLGIAVIPEIDLPGHSEAALTAYPQYSCFGIPPRIPDVGFTPAIFCAGKDSAMLFLKNVLAEVCDLFPSPYVHLGGDEAPKDHWDRCPDCQNRMTALQLHDTHALQLWMAAELARYVGERGKTAIFYGDVVMQEGYKLPQNAIIEWWSYRSKGDLEFKGARRERLKVIGGTNYYNYLNFPLSPWRGYAKERTFGLRQAYTENPSYAAFVEHPESMLGMECFLWTDYNLLPEMFAERLLPRILALSEQMWHVGALPHYDSFLAKVHGLRSWFGDNGWPYPDFETQ
jgi:N-acetyl-beta-hexosaminidase